MGIVRKVSAYLARATGGDGRAVRSNLSGNECSSWENTVCAPEELNVEGRYHSQSKENTELINLLKIDNNGFKVQKKQREILSIYTIHRLRAEH